MGMAAIRISSDAMHWSNMNQSDPNLDDVYDNLHFVSYRPTQSKGSLFRTVITWLIYSMFYLVLCIPILIMICILSLLLAPLTYRWFGRYIIFIWMMTSVLFLHIIEAHQRDMDMFSCVFHLPYLPLIIAILFRRSVIATIKLRENICTYEKMRKYTTHCGIESFTYKIATAIGLVKLLESFAENYRIWGFTLQHYRPFGKIECVSVSKTSTSIKYKTTKELMDSCIARFTSSNHWTFMESVKVYQYNIIDRMMTVVLIVFAFLFVFVPLILCIIIDGHYNGLFVMRIIVDLIINFVIAWSVASDTEIIFYRLFKYHAYMERMGDLLELHQCVHINDIQKGGAILTHDDMKKGAILTYEELLIKLQPINRNTDTDCNCSADVDFPMFLHQAENCEIWFENWCRIENIASTYFENRKSNVFAVITCIAVGIAFVIYSWFEEHTLVTDDVCYIIVGLCYIIVAYLRLLLSSMRFSELQRRHIGLIQNQRIFTLHHMKTQNDYPQSKQLSIEYMKGMIAQIEYRSLSPTICGVSLDVALVKLTVTSFIGFVTSALSYALGKLS